MIDARATPGAGTAALADLVDRARALVDDGFDIAVRGWVTDADQHGF